MALSMVRSQNQVENEKEFLLMLCYTSRFSLQGPHLQAAHLLDMYNTEGAAAFEAYRLPLLTWRESEALKAEHAQPVLDAPKGKLVR